MNIVSSVTRIQYYNHDILTEAKRSYNKRSVRVLIVHIVFQN